MSRVGSGDGWDIGGWEQGDNPGAGSTDFTIFTDTGLNGNFKRLWRGIKSVLNPDGTMQDDKVDGRNIKNTLADGTTIEASASTGVKVFRLKDLGVSTAKLADLAVSTAKLADKAVDAAKLKDDASVDSNRAVTTNHVRDAAITAAKLAASIVSAAKMTHDNNARKCVLQFTYDSAVNSWAKFGNVQTSATIGVPMPRAGWITKLITKSSGGEAALVSAVAYATSGSLHFNAGDLVSVRDTVTPVITPTINGSSKEGTSPAMYVGPPGTSPLVILLEVEFDD